MKSECKGAGVVVGASLVDLQKMLGEGEGSLRLGHVEISKWRKEGGWWHSDQDKH